MKKFISYAAMAVALCACSNNDVTTPEIIDPQSATLSISTSVSNSIALTRTTGTEENLSDAAGTGPVMGTGLASGSQIGVFVFNANGFSKYPGITDQADMNLMWKNTSEGWRYNKSQQFAFGSAKANVYAYFPYTGNESSLSIENADSPKITVAPGYTDYLYGKSEDSNGIIAHDSKKSAATIKLNHALAMVTFTFENTGYTGPAVLQSITLNQLPNSGTLDITTGNINNIAGAANISIQKFDNNSYLTGAWTEAFAKVKIEGTTISEDQVTPGKFHAMVLPQIADAVKDHNATIVIDGVSHNISLKVGQRIPSEQAEQADWEKGKNYTYNLKLSGNNQLTVSTVEVTQWQEGGSSDIEI